MISNKAAYSGAIATYIGILNLNQGKFTQNSAKQSGGVLNGVRYSVFKVKGAQFSNNDGGFYGGVVFVDADSTAFAQNSNFTDNHAGYGGAIYIYVHASVNISTSTFTRNSGKCFPFDPPPIGPLAFPF